MPFTDRFYTGILTGFILIKRALPQGKGVQHADKKEKGGHLGKEHIAETQRHGDIEGPHRADARLPGVVLRLLYAEEPRKIPADILSDPPTWYGRTA